MAGVSAGPRHDTRTAAGVVAARPQPGRSGPGRPPGGSEQKKAAIVAAALRLFLRDGFARTSVDAIAEEAGVSKRTIYNHYGDKENLFLSVVGDTYRSMMTLGSQLMDRYLSDVSANDLDQNVTSFACELGLLLANSPSRSALLRLMMAEAAHFPELRSSRIRPQTVTGELAKRLAVLSARGLLDMPDPEEAADHLFSLTMGMLNNRSLFGVVPLSDEEITRLAASGARAFLRAYRAPGPA